MNLRIRTRFYILFRNPDYVKTNRYYDCGNPPFGRPVERFSLPLCTVQTNSKWTEIKSHGRMQKSTRISNKIVITERQLKPKFKVERYLR